MRYTKMYARTWQDEAFRHLTPNEQRLYWLMLSQPTRYACGVLPLHPEKWATYSIHTSAADIVEHLGGLEAAGIVLVDRNTMEVLIRNHIRDDIADLDNPPSWKLQKGAINTCLQVESSELRCALADELESVLTSLRPEAVDVAEDMAKELHKGYRNPTDRVSKPHRTTTTTTTTTTATATSERSVLEGVQGEPFNDDANVEPSPSFSSAASQQSRPREKSDTSVDDDPDLLSAERDAPDGAGLEHNNRITDAETAEMCTWCEEAEQHPIHAPFCSAECCDAAREQRRLSDVEAGD